MKKYLLALLLILIPTFLFAQFTVFQGGTGRTTYPFGTLFYFDGTRITATSSQPLYVGAITATSSLTSTFITAPTFESLTSALVLTGAGGLTAEYTGTSCTNQFVRSLSALGVATCATVGSADVSLANLTATDSTLTFSGTYNGSTARTIGLNLGNANTWTAIQTFTPGIKIATTTTWLNSISNTVGTTTISGNFSNLRASTTANTTQTIDWSTAQNNGVASTFWDIMLTGNTTIVMNATSSNPIDGGMYKVRLCQDGTGSRTVTWANPVSLRWSNGTTTITSTANKCTFIGFIYTQANGNGIYSAVASSTNVDIR